MEDVNAEKDEDEGTQSDETHPPRRVEVSGQDGAHAAIDRFLAQPPEHGVGDAPDEVEAPAPAHVHRSFWQSIVHFLFEKKPSQYSSISPRKADGTRTKLFFFNGNGRGR